MKTQIKKYGNKNTYYFLSHFWANETLQINNHFICFILFLNFSFGENSANFWVSYTGQLLQCLNHIHPIQDSLSREVSLDDGQ